MRSPDPDPPQKGTQMRERERDRDSERETLVRTDNLTQAFFSFGVVAPSILENAVYDVATTMAFSIVTQSRGQRPPNPNEGEKSIGDGRLNAVSPLIDM